jgi:ubiquinone/menaquinone biosynthesis C-methylase UbiE
MTDFDARAKDWDKDPVRVDRAKAVAEATRRMVPLRPGMTALEYGCGTGLLSFALQPFLGPITLADNSAGMLAVLEEKITASGVRDMTPLKLDLIADPLPPSHFDLIYTLLALHHIHDTDKVLQGLYTLLDRPGVLCIADLDKEDGSFHVDSEFDGHNGFDRDELTRKLLEAGFANIHFSTCYETPKNARLYPLFLAVAEKK